jgi:hypothetical protein
MFSAICAYLFKAWGWRVTGRYPHEIDKLVICVAPHTSNWDFPVGVLVRSAERIKARFVGKEALFRWPHGFLFRWLGGVPVERTKGSNFVAATASAFRREAHMHLVIAPEGTRKKVDRFRTGFYFLAKEAGVPIVLCTFNWQTRTVHFDEQLFYPGQDEQADLMFIWNYFKDVPGYHPEKGITDSPSEKMSNT